MPPGDSTPYSSHLEPCANADGVSAGLTSEFISLDEMGLSDLSEDVVSRTDAGSGRDPTDGGKDADVDALLLTAGGGHVSRSALRRWIREEASHVLAEKFEAAAPGPDQAEPQLNDVILRVKIGCFEDLIFDNSNRIDMLERRLVFN